MMIPCGEALSRILLSALGRPTVMLAGQKGVPAVLGENAKKTNLKLNDVLVEGNGKFPVNICK